MRKKRSSRAASLLEKALVGDQTPARKRLIREAVKAKRKRVQRENVNEPKTELGRRIRAHSDTAARLADCIVRQVADETLKGAQANGQTSIKSPGWHRGGRYLS
jgi:hypothetical protein